MPFRKLFFWCHLTAGVLCGLVILTMAATGVILAFERQIVAFAERDLRTPATGLRAHPLPLSSIVSAADEANGASATTVIVRSDPRAPATVAFGRSTTLFVNRHTGAVLGKGAEGLRRFFDFNEDVHRRLASGDAGHDIISASNLVFLFIVLSGFWIWIPRRFNADAFRKIALFRSGLSGKARDFNWHNVLGAWAAIPLALIVVSGVVISYPAASALVYRAFGEAPPERPRSDGVGRGTTSHSSLRSLDVVWTATSSALPVVAPKWQSVTIRLPLAEGRPATVAVDEGSGARPDKKIEMKVDAGSGRIVDVKTYADRSSGQRARAWLRWIHTGEAGGVVGQLVAMIASAVAVVLVWTGLSLALRRFRRWVIESRKEEVEA